MGIKRTRRKRGGDCKDKYKKCEESKKRMKGLGIKSVLTCKPCPQEETKSLSSKTISADEAIKAARIRKQVGISVTHKKGRSADAILTGFRAEQQANKREEEGGRRRMRRRKSTKKKKRRRRRKSTKKKRRRRRRKSRK